MDTETVKRAKFIGDSKEACFKEVGDIIIPMVEGGITESHFYGELGKLIIWKKKGRINNNKITIFKSNGLAIQNTATALLVYQKAIQGSVGITVEI